MYPDKWNHACCDKKKIIEGGLSMCCDKVLKPIGIQVMYAIITRLRSRRVVLCLAVLYVCSFFH